MFTPAEKKSLLLLCAFLVVGAISTRLGLMGVRTGSEAPAQAAIGFWGEGRALLDTAIAQAGREPGIPAAAENVTEIKELPKGAAAPSLENAALDSRAEEGKALSGRPGFDRRGKSGKKNPMPSSPIAINQATASELARISGIGPKLAQAILRHRQEHGAFTSIEQLRDVKGIGEKKLEKIRGAVIISSP